MLRRFISLVRHTSPVLPVVIALICGGVNAACTSTGGNEGGGGLPELDVQDPDPQTDTDVPKFCNPTGKSGGDLTQCYAQNEALYKEFDEEARKREPWFNFTPDSWLESPELDGKLVQPVEAAKERDATLKLEKVSVVEIPAAEAEALTGKPEPVAGKKALLVRGLFYYRDSGSFTVFEKDQQILVRHDSIGQETNAEQRTAVVVYLDYLPKEIFVDCGVTQ